MSTPWIRGEIEPCLYCELPVYLRWIENSNRNGRGVGHPMGETYAHYECPNEALQQVVADLRRRLYEAEAPLVALYRMENVPDSVLGDQAQFDRSWATWKASHFGKNDAPPQNPTNP